MTNAQLSAYGVANNIPYPNDDQNEEDKSPMEAKADYFIWLSRIQDHINNLSVRDIYDVSDMD